MDAESLELETATRIGRDDGGSSTAVSSGTSLSGQPGEIGSGAGVAGPSGIHKGARNRCVSDKGRCAVDNMLMIA